MKSTYPDLDPHQVSVIDPITKRQLEITHYAATLGACIVSTTGLKIDFLERDVDAYNISRLYNLADTKLYAAFEDYYNVSKHYKRRYHIFKQQLLKEFDADSIYAVAFRFAKQEITMLSWLFGLAFGKFNEEFIEIVAHAFEDKIETQISIEEYTA